MKIRLDKYLADLGYGTRKEVKKLIRSGQFVTVNDEYIRDDDYKVDTLVDDVLVNDEKLEYEEKIYIMLNKPEGYVSATIDNLYPTVLDLIDVPLRREMFPVGRLDVDTTGLLIITNDGMLSHKALSSKNHVEKEYYVEYEGTLVPNVTEIFENGMDIGDEKPTLPAKILLCGENKALVTLVEGRFHQVKRMIEVCGGNVVVLKRIRFGTLLLDENLELGESRRLTQEEVDRIFD